MGARKLPSVDLRLGLLDERSRRRIVRVERRDLRLQPLVVAGDLGQRFGQLVVRDVRILADDLQQRLGRVLGHAESLADFDNLMGQRLGRAFHRRLGHLLELFVRQPEIAGDSVAAGAAAVGDGARPSLDPCVPKSKGDWRYGDHQDGDKHGQTRRTVRHGFAALGPSH